MSGAGLALALALLVAPGPRRRWLQLTGGRARRPMPVPVAAWQAIGLLVLMVVAPFGVVLAGAIAALTIEVRRRRRRRQRRRAAEAAALEGALDVLVGELRIGAHPVAAFEAASMEVDGAVAASLRTVAARARMGADVAAGLRSVAEQSAMPAHWQRLALCWQLAQSHGLAIAALIHTAQRDIVARERFSAQVTAGMAGARTTAAVLAALPLLGVGLGELIGAQPLRFLFSSGQWLLVVGVTLTCLGLAWADRITGGVVRRSRRRSGDCRPVGGSSCRACSEPLPVRPRHRPRQAGRGTRWCSHRRSTCWPPACVGDGGVCRGGGRRAGSAATAGPVVARGSGSARLGRGPLDGVGGTGRRRPPRRGIVGGRADRHPPEQRWRRASSSWRPDRVTTPRTRPCSAERRRC